MKTDANGRHHMRRQDRAMPDRAEQLDVIRGSRFLTLAMSRDNQPYLVSLCYAFDERENCFYAHGATAGKKLEYVRANPRVWGQVLDDAILVLDGQCVQEVGQHGFVLLQEPLSLVLR